MGSTQGLGHRHRGGGAVTEVMCCVYVCDCSRSTRWSWRSSSEWAQVRHTPHEAWPIPSLTTITAPHFTTAAHRAVADSNPAPLVPVHVVAEKAQAGRVLPLITRHHVLLVTLLLYNAAANEALPIFFDDLMPTPYAVGLSVTMVTRINHTT